MSTLTITLPDYLSIDNYRKITHLDHLQDLDRMISTVVVLSDLQEETVRDFRQADISTIYRDVLDRLIHVTPEFFPIFKLEDTFYGFSAITKMTVGEYADLQNLAKDPLANLEEIMALLYRPITKDHFGTIKWAIHHGVSVAKEEAEDLFAFYEIEKYDNAMRKVRAKQMKDLPVSFALGALSFFLQVGQVLLENSQHSSLNKKEMRRILRTIKKTPMQSIGGGLSLFLTSRKLPSLQSQEIHALQMSI